MVNCILDMPKNGNKMGVHEDFFVVELLRLLMGQIQV